MSINVPVGMGSAADPRVPLTNLTTVRGRLDSLQRFLSESVNTNTVISKNQMEMVSSELSSAIQQTIVNAAALLACSQSVAPPPPMPAELRDPPDRNKEQEKQLSFQLKEEVEGEERHNIDGGGGDVVEVDAVELLAEHVHFCEICGKGFKRDANLRMHMRAHGNQFRTLEALAKPAAAAESGGGVSTKARFSCPFDGCNRNRKHKKFRPLKSVLCVKNHFKRSHCPKLYSCNRCHKKNFSVVADLKSHLKHCGESRWKCSCGTSFSRKDKLFGHMALFEGHMPAVEGEEGEGEAGAEVKGSKSGAAMAVDDDGFFDGLMDGVGGGGGSMEGCSLQDVLEYPTSSNWVTEMSFFCGFEL